MEEETNALLERISEDKLQNMSLKDVEILILDVKMLKEKANKSDEKELAEIVLHGCMMVEMFAMAQRSYITTGEFFKVS